ncbi:MAG: 3'-5' exonuclease [Mesorhizobium sp.]|nr:MAG: 3'-5' exonuclease [Mesorhizobium sp.]
MENQEIVLTARVRAVDIETLFQEPEPNGIVEIGYTDIVATKHDLFGEPIDWEVRVGEGFLINPMQPIPAETSAVHHIIDSDVVGAPLWRDVHPLVFDTPALAYVAHGAKFEREWISTEITGATPWIDTYRCALRLHPESPTFSNNGLRYHLRPEGIVRELCMPPHRALPDSYVTAHTVRDFLNAGHSVAELVKWTNEPALLPRCKIGDTYRNGGKGTLWKDVESSMLRWILSKDFDEDTVFTVRKEIERREIDQRLENERVDLNRQFRANSLPETPPAQELPPVTAYETQEMFPL